MKNKTTAAIFALILGGLGIHKFYLGKSGPGILYILFCWTGIPSIIGFIEGIKLLCMNEDSFDQEYNNKSAFVPPVLSFEPAYTGEESAIAKDLVSLFDLKEKGAITDEDYLEKKKELQDPSYSSHYDELTSSRIKDIGIFYDLFKKGGMTKKEYDEKKNNLLSF
jgi:TM2 domain-containing membrane protein YozV